MESETSLFETAFSNLLQELKEIRQQQAETNKALSDLKEKIEGFEQKLNNVKVAAPSLNTLPITSTINEGIDKIKNTIEEQPKSITRQFKILLFPEYGATEYYKLVFGRVLCWMLTVLTATYLFALGKQYIEMSAIVKTNQLENDNIRKAWKYLYNHNGKAVKDKMDSAYLVNKNNLHNHNLFSF